MNRIDIKIALGEVGAIIGFFLGNIDGLIISLVIFAIVDYVTGVVAGAFTHTLSSEVGFRGIAKKVLLFGIVGVANILDKYILGGQAVARTAVCLFYIANEGLSILENVIECGIPVPNKLKVVLEQIREESEDINDDKKGD